MLGFRRLGHELQLLFVRNKSALKPAVKKTPNRFPPFVAVIESPMVDVHADKFIGKVPAHIARELQSVLNRLRTMIEAELNAGGEDIGNRFAGRRVEAFVNDVAAERKRQTVVFRGPPCTQVLANLQSLVAIS